MRDSLPAVLIIDDSPEDRAVLRRYLGDEYRIIDAARGDQGLALDAEHQPDCVLLDYRLPDMDGLQDLNVRHGERAAASAVIMLTGSGDTAAVAVQAMKSGAHDYLNKNTLEAEELKRAVRSALNDVMLKRELKQQRLTSRRTEELLSASDERFRLIVEMANEGVWSMNPDARTEYVNDRLAQMLGCDRHEVVALDPLEFVFPDDRPAAREIIAHTLQGQNVQFDFRLRRKDGGEVWVLASNGPLRDAQGRIEGTLGMISDITERRQTQHALEASNERFRTAFHANPLALAIGSFPEERLLEVNVAWTRVTGFSHGDVLDKTSAEFHFYRDLAHRAEYFDLLADHGQVHDFETAIRTAAGDIRQVLMSSDVIVLDGRQCLLSSIQDITARKQLEETLRLQTQQLQYADRQKDEFIAMLAHELRNPLAPIRNAVRILALSQMSEPHTTQAREIIGRQVEHLSRLIDDLLDVSRITHGKVTLQMARIDLKQILSEAVEVARPLIEARHHTLSVSVPPAPILVDGDSTRLVQVFGNILNNAAKYTNEGGQIFLSAALTQLSEAGAQRVAVTVRDNGRGIATELLPHVFELFTQADPRIDPATGGLGIGLSLVKRLVELHGGTVQARSSGVECGSEFVVHLPVALSASVAAPTLALIAGRRALENY